MQTRVRTAPPEHIDALIRAGQHPLLARLYAARGVTSNQALETSLTHLLPPASMLGCQAAAKRLADALERQERILVIADYDCDGATACAVAVRGLRMLGAAASTVDYLVPNRFEYGYGLTPEIVALAQTPRPHQQSYQKPNLLITVDNGIASIEGVAAAHAAGLDVLITDHHLPGSTLPDASIIVNPNQPGCLFASKHIAGVGVMFYVLLALRAELRARGKFTVETQPRLDTLLDLVALGTVADVVRLDTNNRIFVTQGLQRMRQGRLQPGLAALFHAAGREARSATAFDLGFAVGPRLNAAGRLQDMSLGIECLLTDDPGRAFAIANELNQINQERREIESQMQEQARQALQSAQLDAEYNERCSITLFDPDWHQGVIGILAGRIKEQWHRPTIVLAAAASADDEEVWLKGSGRSIPGIHLRDVLDLISKQHPTLLKKFGGHAMAAGLTLHADDLDLFEEAFEHAVQQMAEQAASDPFQRLLEIDGALEDAYLSVSVAQLLEQQVWGQGFPAPLFVNQFRVISQRLLKEKHLKLVLKTSSGQTLDGIFFNHPESLPNDCRLAFRVTTNTYNGNTTCQIQVEHLIPE